MIIAILQARMSSSRLPGKVMMPILNKPMLAHQIDRIKRCKSIDKLILATSSSKEDRVLAHLARQLNIDCYRGSLDNVLERFYSAAKSYSPEHIVRLTGDCPLADPELIDELIDHYLQGNYDYVGIEESFPDGLDAEIMTYQALSEAYNEAMLPSEKEHVTPFINKQPERYRLGALKSDSDYSTLRWTVDEKEDFELITKIYESLHPKNPEFSWLDVLNLIKANPKLAVYNTKYQRNEGLKKSLLIDKKFFEENDGSL